jgi:hypothetical protein
LRKSTRRP